jgi:S-adenosylmethionine:tRNA ribosyltransferase-isomerase
MTAATRPRRLVTAKEQRQESVRPLAFALPKSLEAHEPPEARGLGCDAVRLMVSHVGIDAITHARFRDFPDFLARADVVVVNASATMNAALDAWRLRPGGEFADRIALHLSTPLPDGHWAVELRHVTRDGTAPLLDAMPGEQIALAAGATATLVEPLASRIGGDFAGRTRLWVAEMACPGGVLAFAAAHGSPIRYSYVRQHWPISYYQTVFATEPGSAEMPSAGRAFTPELITRLIARGVLFAPLLLHAGVASLEQHEAPYEEYYRVPATSALVVNAARAAGGRVIAIGTTSVRALETAADKNGHVRAAEGWTDLIITPDRGLPTVDGLLTGLHEPRATHLALLAALAGFDHLRQAYAEALRERYLWHEFGDLHLILPG